MLLVMMMKLRPSGTDEASHSNVFGLQDAGLLALTGKCPMCCRSQVQLWIYGISAWELMGFLSLRCAGEDTH